MKKNTSNKQRTGKGNRQEQEKGAFAFYIGIDLGDKYGETCVMNPAGEVHQQCRLRMKATDLEDYFRSIGRSRVAVEAGGQSQWVAELIERCGHQVYVSNTRKVAYIYESDDKDDPGDAYKLAELVHFKPRLLHPIQHRSQALQAREALVESRTQLINTIRGISKAFRRAAAEVFGRVVYGQVGGRDSGSDPGGGGAAVGDDR